MYDYPENTKHMHTIHTMLDQRRMLYNCLLGRPCSVNTLYKEPEKYVFINVAYIQLTGEGLKFLEFGNLFISLHICRALFFLSMFQSKHLFQFVRRDKYFPFLDNAGQAYRT